MKHLNVEIKAQCKDLDSVRVYLKSKHADFKGVDHQVDTYFKVSNGRMKLREGDIENHLIHYNRETKAGPKQSHVTLFVSTPGSSLKELLTKALGILVVVDKKREIYYIDNVKFHVDSVENLGTFIEIEAIGDNRDLEKLQKQCDFYLKALQIEHTDLLNNSYSDLLIEKRG